MRHNKARNILLGAV